MGIKTVVLSGNEVGGWFLTMLLLLIGWHNQLLETMLKVHTKACKTSVKSFFSKTCSIFFVSIKD